MYCGECGTKLKKGDLFCGECGAKVEKKEPTKQTKKQTGTKQVETPNKSMNKKTKIVLVVVAILVIASLISYQIFSNKYSPKQVAKDYVDALVKKDASKLYSYMNIEGDKTFVNKKAFEKIMKDSESTTDIENYAITDVEYASGKLSATVTISYTTKSSSSEKTRKIPLTKAKEKKLLFFDDWKISDLSTDSMIVKDYEMTVPKNASITFAGVKVDKKFLNKDESTDSLDVYILPQVFSAETEIKIELANGIELTKEITPSNYRNYYKFALSLDTLSKDDQKKLNDAYLKDLKTLYQAGIERKSWDDIKATYTKNKVDTTNLQEAYTEFLEGLTSASTILKSIDFTKAELSSVSMNDDGDLVVRAKASYKYTVEFTSLDETKTKNSSSYNYITLTYQMNGKEYNLIDAKNLSTYFSRY